MTEVVGILNITPDSFSDGGKYIYVEEALQHAEDMIRGGVKIIDIGAESTKPGVTPVSEDEEWARLWDILPRIINVSRMHSVKVSFDSRHYANIEKAVDLGIDIINDVSGLSDPRICKLAATHRKRLVLMHSMGVPANPMIHIERGIDPVEFVYNWAKDKVEQLKNDFDIHKNEIIFDPGIGFGKTPDQCLELIRRISEFKKLGVQIMVGHSRKSFMSLLNNLPPEERDIETRVISGFLTHEEVDFVRVHDAVGTVRALKAYKAVLNGLKNNDF